MEKKIKLLLFNNIAAFILLTGIYNFSIYISEYHKFSEQNHTYGKKLNIGNYRLLAKCKQNMDICPMKLKEWISNNDMDERKDISNNERKYAEIKKQSNGSLSNNRKDHKKHNKNKSCIFETKKYSRMEKKIFKELDYADFLKNNKTISDKIYKKIMGKKYGFRLSLPIFFVVLLSILLLLDLFVGYGLINGLFYVLNIIAQTVESSAAGGVTPLKKMLRPLHEWLKNSPFGSFFKSASQVAGSAGKPNVDKHYYITGFFGFLIYFIPVFIIGVTCILGIFYYHKKVKKYEKIKFRKG
ncbi:uncharacterized protein MKS88_000263 [Plasmodium brasilianum]|uniref:uncharacterized protein n=1 Tax=Plasmodium brasilianum TaxID=5824 RepID=UPI00350E4A4C|nr:hypothetical protein MKS88_000263 [Plasmodium brasilianum]